MKNKYLAYGIKPYSWFKGSFLVLIGLLLSRWDVGVGRLDSNICFGLPIYFLIASSVMLTSLILKIEEAQDNRNTNKKLTISSAVLFGTAFVTSVIHTASYNLDILNVFILALIGVILILSLYYGKSWEKKDLLANTLISLSPSVGIIYGASLNGTLIPIIVFLFFGAVFFLQFSKDLINESKNKEKYHKASAGSLAVNLGEEKTKKISILFDLIVILLIILPIFLDFIYIPFLLYLIPMVLTVIIVGLAALLTFLMKPERTYYRIVKILLRIGMFFVFATILLASF